MQQGALGDGPAFVSLPKPVAETELTYTEKKGVDQSGDDEAHAKRRTINLGAGTAVPIGGHFAFFVAAHGGTTAFDSKTTDTPTTSITQDVAQGDFGAGPSLRLGPYSLGGFAAMRFFGKETRRVTAPEDDVAVAVDAVVIPTLMLHAGFHGDGVIAVARAKLYNDARTNVRKAVAEGPPGSRPETSKDDGKRRSPGELAMDLSLSAGPEITLAAGAAFIGTARAAESFARERSRADDRTRLSLGGLMRAAAWFSISGAISYVTAGWNKVQDASLLEDDLGGVRVDLGTHTDMGGFILDAGVGYVVSETVDYDNEPVPDAGWKKAGEPTTVEQGGFDVRVGARFDL